MSRPAVTVAAAPLVISDASAFAVVGLKPRAFRAFIRGRGLPYTHAGRRMFVRADVLLHALGLADMAPVAAPASPKWSAETLLARLTGGAAAAAPTANDTARSGKRGAR